MFLSSTVPAAVPSATHGSRPSGPYAAKTSRPPTAPSGRGRTALPLLHVPDETWESICVPASVPSLFQICTRCVPSSAAKKTASPTAVR